MHPKSIFSALIATAALVAAAPATDSIIQIDPDLRFIKTSEVDPGTWVTDEQKITEYVAKNINFIDITDITDPETLLRLSTVPEATNEALSARAVTYPTTLTHQTEANALIAQLSNTGPQSWLLTLTE
jgi:leucyl aminopeptidase